MVSSVMFSHLLDDTLIITLLTGAYTGHWLSIKLSKSVKWDVPALSLNKINGFPIRRRNINHVSGKRGRVFSADRTSRYCFLAVLRNFKKSAVRL